MSTVFFLDDTELSKQLIALSLCQARIYTVKG